MTAKVYVVAATYQQALDWALRTDLNPRLMVWVDSPARLRGHTNPVVQWVEGWQRHPLAKEILEQSRVVAR